MPPHHTTASSHIPAPHRTQTGRIAKSKANAKIGQVTAPAHEPGPAPNPADFSAPRLDITLLNALTTRLEGYESGLDALKTTIRENQIESRQANVDTFSQLMERLDNLGTAPAVGS